MASRPEPQSQEPFQSTLPVRGATFASDSVKSDGGISIHAPREGSDVQTHLRRCHSSISIHAPREGSDRPGS